MRVRMKVDISGTRAGQEWPPRGSVIDLPDAEAADYCKSGMAEPVAVFNEPEVSDPPAPETRGPLTKAKGPRAERRTDG